MVTPPPPESQVEYSLLDYLEIARKHWQWIALPVVLMTGLACVYSIVQPDRFEASAGVLLADSAAQRALDPTSQNSNFLKRELSNEIKLANSDKVELLVTEQLGQLPAVAVRADAEADMLVFTASSATPEAAALEANVWADVYIEVKQTEAVRTIDAAMERLTTSLEAVRAERQTLRAPLDDIEDRIDQADPAAAASLQREYDRLAEDLRYELELLDNRAASSVASLTELDLQAGISGVGEAQVIEVAEPPDQRSNAPLSRNAALGLVVGLIVGFGLALLAETRDNTINSAADVAAITDLPVLATVPKATKRQQQGLGLATTNDPDGVFADSYQKLRSSLEFLSLETVASGNSGGPVTSIMITSANPAEGKSTTSANLALAMSSVGRRTILVDLDFRRPTVHSTFGVRQAPGVSDFVLRGVDMSKIAYSFPGTRTQELLIMPSGSVPPSPASFVGTRRFLSTIEWLTTQADVVLFDSPPLLAVSDGHTIAKHVDAVVVTARAGETTASELTEALIAIKQVGANPIGVVLIGIDEPEGYSKRSYYGEFAGVPTDDGHILDLNAEDLWGHQQAMEALLI